MDGFGDSFVPPAEGAPVNEVDPAAEFLAREQDQLAGLEDDLGAPAAQSEQPAAPIDKAAPPPVFGSEDFAPQPMGEDPWASTQPSQPTEEAISQPEAEEGPGFLEPLSSQITTVGDGEGFLPATDLAGAAAEAATAPQGDCTGFGADFGGATVPAGDTGMSAGAFSFVGESAVQETAAEPEPARSPVPPVVREEPEKIKLWREQQRLRLEEKDAAENKNKEELKEKAKKELEDWYKQHEEQVAKTRQANRSAEKELVAETGKMEPGTEWERITKLCDFNPKTSKSSRDISRMRSIILQVKQNPPIKA
ncbi:clathrin light chain-like isoform X5 [Penaeus chinensis]|uniref:clathrin light chain-like isoform X5 n=1 Tax=Penaeus chinensis TaxID=139456 RepID=UPI001FB78D78|nr:clathrin light chain-like isoform X5 [Penaeus chinensis]